MLSEADYLQQQSARARAGFQESARALADEVLAPLEIRPFIRNRPWSSLGGATVGGVLFGCLLGRRRRGTGRPPGGGKFAGLFAAASRRVGRVLKSALGAMVVANFRRGGSVPSAVATNGHERVSSPEAI